MPTKEECEELVKMCIWTWTAKGGQNGYQVTGPNGNYIFLPAAGLRTYVNNSSFRDVGLNGLYWSSTPHYADSYSYKLSFNSDNHEVSWSDRPCGFSVRPVTK